MALIDLKDQAFVSAVAFDANFSLRKFSNPIRVAVQDQLVILSDQGMAPRGADLA
ncbi:MAG TPA: hypothetical protein VIW94_03235 [Acidimicrobiia bacterium]